jgi:triosephosphate isomerase
VSVRPVVVGVSLKMFFGVERTRQWLVDVARLVRARPALSGDAIEIFILPTYLGISTAVEKLAGTGVGVGAQNVAAFDPGPLTGEIAAADLLEVGARYAAVGHAERRQLFGEDDAVVAAKTAIALRNGLTPVICVGERAPGPASEAAGQAVRQLNAALARATEGRVLVAYEPVWAIGAERFADPAHVRVVGAALRATLDADAGRSGSSVIYGGSAGPKLLAELRPAVDGVFLGRRAHRPDSLADVLDEALAAARTDLEAAQ